ncbi:MAG: hypothetical protein AAFX87_25300 [Bacteroidota bacterium]
MSQSAKRRSPGAPKLKRQKAVRNLSLGTQRRHTASVSQRSASPGKRRESRASKAPGVVKSKEPVAGLSPKPDRWFKGRNLYPTAGADGKTVYLPQQSDTTPSELRRGQFVKDVDNGKEATPGQPPKKDQTRGRNLYAAVGDDGVTTYLPQKSDATPAELLKGQFVKDVDTGKAVIDGKSPKKDRWYKGRNLYPAEGVDRKTVYLPQKSEATPSELLKGQFVKDVDAGKDVLDGAPPKPDRWYRGRNLYPALGDDGKTIYLPQKSDATPSELLRGRYVKDEDLGKEVIEGYAPKEDQTRGRNLYATLAEAGQVIYLPQESEATPSELQKGQFVQDLDRGKDVIEALPKNMKPKIDSNSRVDDQGRLLYPVKVPSEAEGEPYEIVYYPKESEATEVEKRKGLFIRYDEIKDESITRRRAERVYRIQGRNRSNALSE